MASIGMIGDDVHGVCGDRHGGSEVGVLPTGGSLIGKSRCGEQLACTAPEASGVDTRIKGVFIKPDPVDEAIDVSLEPHAELDRLYDCGDNLGASGVAKDTKGSLRGGRCCCSVRPPTCGITPDEPIRRRRLLTSLLTSIGTAR